MTFLILLGVVAGVILLCFAGIGVGIFLAGRRRIGACSCDFDADRARKAHAQGGCCGAHAECEHKPAGTPPA